MAFSRYGKANIVSHNISSEKWKRVRVGSTSGTLTPTLVEQASEILQEKFNPERFLLSHATIVCSVDTQVVPNVRLGKIQEGTTQIHRKYADYRIKKECEKFINNNCFVPGTLITMVDGTVKPIEDICVGDVVMTHKGHTRKVTETFCHKVDDEIYEICPRGTTERTYVTAEHPVFVFRPNKKCVCCGELIKRNVKAISHLLGRFYCSRFCYYKTKKPNNYFLQKKEGEFVEVSNLSEFDFSTHPIPSDTKSLDLTLGQARLIGLFAAEGYYELNSRNDNEKVGVCWAYSIEEENTLARDTVKLLDQEFGVKGVIRHHSSDNGIHVTSKTNRALVEFFSHWVHGETSKDKTLHPHLIKANPSIQKEILRGWFEGDGSLFDTAQEGVPGDIRFTGNTASRSLANQMQILLLRIGVSSRVGKVVNGGRKRLVLDNGEVRVINDPSKTCVSWDISCGAGWISNLVENTYYEDQYQKFVEARGGLQKTSSLRFLNGYHLQMVGEISKVEYSGFVYNFEVEEDHSYIANGIAVHNCDSWSRPVIKKSYQTFIGAHSFVEHVQLEELSKGRIIDAVARDIGPSVYIDILVANDRKHKSLIRQIESGEMSTLSMGCSVLFTICTKCGHVAADETEMCTHVKFSKGNYFHDDFGIQHKIAELCGHGDHPDDTGGVIFSEASWVKVPAFVGAVLRNIINIDGLDIENIKRAEDILRNPPKTWTTDHLSQIIKAASMMSAVHMAQFDFGDQGDDDEESAPETAPEPFSELENEVKDFVLRRVKKNIKDEISKDDKSTEPSTVDAPISPNQNLIREANFSTVDVYKMGLDKLVRTASSDGQFMQSLVAFNHAFGVKVPRHIYETSLRVGSTSRYKSLGLYVQSCKHFLGRMPSIEEARTLIRIGKLLSLRKHVQ